jgi:hypothetical protein
MVSGRRGARRGSSTVSSRSGTDENAPPLRSTDGFASDRTARSRPLSRVRSGPGSWPSWKGWTSLEMTIGSERWSDGAGPSSSRGRWTLGPRRLPPGPILLPRPAQHLPVDVLADEAGRVEVLADQDVVLSGRGGRREADERRVMAERPRGGALCSLGRLRVVGRSCHRDIQHAVAVLSQLPEVFVPVVAAVELAASNEDADVGRRLLLRVTAPAGSAVRVVSLEEATRAADVSDQDRLPPARRDFRTTQDRLAL